MEQHFVRDESGQLYQLTPQAVNEDELKAEAAAAEEAFNARSQEVEQLEEALKNAQAAVEQVQNDLTAKVQEKADAEAAHVLKSAGLAAIANAGPMVNEQPESGEEPAANDDAVDEGPSSSVEEQVIPVTVVSEGEDEDSPA